MPIIATNTPAKASQSRSAATRPSRVVWRAGLTAAAVAAAVNLTVFAAVSSSGAQPRVRFSGGHAAQEITAGDVVGATVIALGAGTVMAAVWLRRRNRGLAAGQVVGAAVAVVSVGVPLSVHAAAGTKAALVAMHLVAGVAFVIAMERASTERRQARRGRPTEPLGRPAQDEAV